MAKIVFLPLPEAGHIHATFGLARQLVARAHEVSYLVPPDGEAYLRPRNWPFTLILQEILPKGYHAQLHAKLADPGLSLRERRELNADFIRRRDARNEEVLFGASFEAQLRASQADLLIVDATFPLPILAAHKVGLPAVQLCTNLPLSWDPAVPPLTSTLIPTKSLTSRLRIHLAWQWLYFLAWIPGGERIHAQVREFFRRYPDCPPGDFRSHLQIGPNLPIPTLITCSPEFDFPRASSERLHYLGPCVDRDRPEPPLPAAFSSEDTPLILCSLGSHGDRVREHLPFFQAVIEAVARRPQWRLLMAVGDQVNAAAFGSLPPHVHVVDKVPQLATLKRSAAMITHGGLNSVKECICLGVPMIVYPLIFDQPGNAARVVHHGLGLRGDIRHTSAARIGTQLDEVMNNPIYRSRVRALQRIFLDADENGRGAETVERLVQSRAWGNPVLASAEARSS